MTEPHMQDQAEFFAAFEKYAPEEYLEARNIANGAPERDEVEVTTRLQAWSLDAPWLRRGLLELVRDIRQWGDIARWPGLVEPAPMADRPLVMTWRPAEGESEKAFRDRARRLLNEYVRSIQAEAKAKGIVRAYERERDLPLGVDRWQLLLLRRVRGWPVQRVADHFRVDRKSVTTALRDLERRIGLLVSLGRTTRNGN